jgi:dolichol-phosphate mannosyltransferase
MNLVGLHWEVIYVNDGSSDRTQELLLRKQASDPRVTVLELSRNWGHQAAISAGLAAARGNAVVLMDGDLQDPPGVIVDLVAAWKEGAQVVVAKRRSRQESYLRRSLFRVFYGVICRMSDCPIPLQAGIFGLLDRQAVDSLNSLSETNRYIPGLRSWIGFPTRIIVYDRAARAGGEPKATLFRLLRYAMDAIFSFSYKPLRFSFFFGMAVALFSMLMALVFLVARFFHVGFFGEPFVAGYTSLIVSVLFLGGIQMIGIGILGEYIGRIYDEVKRRPLYVVRAVHKSEPAPKAKTAAG